MRTRVVAAELVHADRLRLYSETLIAEMSEFATLAANPLDRVARLVFPANGVGSLNTVTVAGEEEQDE